MTADVALLEACGAGRRFATARSGPWPWAARETVTAVARADLALRAGDAVGLVGESGSGKTTLARLMVGLLEPTAGEIRWRGQPLRALAPEERRALSRQVQMVFQDPQGSLNPRKTVAQILCDPLHWQGLRPQGPRDPRVLRALDQVRLPTAVLTRHPHAFSGGQRQRIGLARALVLEPRVLVLDEPLSALDVSVQAQVLELLDTLQRELDLSLLFVSHDLAAVRWLCRSVAVMQRGQIIESGETSALFAAPRHPYTRELLGAVLGGHPARRRTAPLPEEDDE